MRQPLARFAEWFAPSPWARAAYFGLSLCLICVVADAPTFGDDLVFYSVLDAVIGLLAFVFCGVFFFAAWAVREPLFARLKILGTAARPNLTFMLLVHSAALVPSLYFAELLCAYVQQEPFDWADYWGYWVYGFVINGMLNLSFAHASAREEVLKLQSAASDARYNLLRTQMQPHFLFNSLNSLAELIATQSVNAEAVTLKLGDLYKLILDNSEADMASLASELEIARAYLEIEQVRFRHRLRFAVSGCSRPEAVQIPSLLLQTLVENAVKHGVAKSTEGGEVTIEVSDVADQGFFKISVINTGSALAQPVALGHGLKNCQNRLQLLYGDRHKFSLFTDGQNRTVVSFFFRGIAHG